MDAWNTNAALRRAELRKLVQPHALEESLNFVLMEHRGNVEIKLVALDKLMLPGVLQQ